MTLRYSYNPPKNPIPYLFLTKRHVYVRSILKTQYFIEVRPRVVKIAHYPVLDLGCNKYKIVANAIGVDVGSSLKPDVMGSALTLPFKNESFHNITALELIEHFNDKDQHRFLRQVYRVLKAEGQFIISTPNISETTRKLHDCLFYVSHTLYAPKDVRSHIGELTHGQLKQRLLNHGFKIVSEKAFSFFNYVVECEKR